MRVRRNTRISTIHAVNLMVQPELIRRWHGWTHLERRVKERVFPMGTQEEIQLFIETLHDLLQNILLGKTCLTSHFIIKMGVYGIFCTFADGVLTIHTIYPTGTWARNEGLFASNALTAEVAEDVYSQVYGLYLHWKNQMRSKP